MHRAGINRFCSNKISLIIQSGCHSHVLFSFSIFSAPALFKYAEQGRRGNEISEFRLQVSIRQECYVG